MASITTFENALYQLYIEFFRRAEDKRRWNLWKDVPWQQANPQVEEDVAYIVESFMAVEMFLPDYTSKILYLIRSSRGRAWFQANWGYEESKHSLALEEWLVASGKRSREEIFAFGEQILQRKWDLPFETPRQMMLYTVFQELSTGLNYLNLRKQVEGGKDPALAQALRLIATDETAHYQFFLEGSKLMLQADRDGTLRDLQKVIKNFKMPAQALIPDWEHRGKAIVGAKIFSNRIFLTDIVRPILAQLGIREDEIKALNSEAPSGSPALQKF